LPSARLVLRIASGVLIVGILAVFAWPKPPEPAPETAGAVEQKGASGTRKSAALATRTLPTSRTPDAPEWMPAELRVVVRTAEGRPVAHARVESDCGWAARTDGGGEWVQLLPSGACSLRALREDGLLRVTSDVQSVVLEPGGLTEAHLVLPDEPQGGIGVAVASAEQGLRVRAVRPDSPASEAGLGPDDVVLEVDGRPTQGWTPPDFADAVIGPLGTPVVLKLQVDDTGDDGLRVLTRAWLAPGSTTSGPERIALSSLTDAQRREVAAIREALAALDDGDGTDLDAPEARALVERVAAIAASAR